MAYGHVPRPAGSDPSSLKPRVYSLPERAQSAERSAVIAVPFHAEGDDLATYRDKAGKKGLKPPRAVLDYLANVFNEELALGVSYPQRGPLDQAEFEAYFLGYDLIVAFFLGAEAMPASVPEDGVEVSSDLIPSLETLDMARSVAGFYYIKPNYPGRSSHLCNAGFVVPPVNRGLGLGGVLGRSFLHFGPHAGYKGSVFNLVYVNNMASVKIWQRLGFTIVGRLPMAGSLKTKTGQEELTDAFIIFKDFTGKVQDTATAAAKTSDSSLKDASSAAN